MNAIIRGLDRLASERAKAIVVMCTNRAEAIDPAVRRRAALEIEFERPGPEQRRTLLESLLDGALDAEDLDRLVTATGSQEPAKSEFTYSDLADRLVPRILMEAYPDRPIDLDLALDVASGVQPTAPFGGDGAATSQ